MERTSVRRVYVERSRWPSDWRSAESRTDFEIDGDEHHYLFKVLRLPADAEVEIFDGQGTIARCRIAVVGKRSARLRIEETRSVAEPPARLHIFLALIKRERFEWALEKLTELGVDEITPMTTERSVVRPRGAGDKQRRERHERIIVAASRQSERAFLPTFHPCRSFHDIIAETASAPCPTALLWPGAGRSLAELVEPASRFRLLIGPEGGFSSSEIDSAIAAGMTTASLGDAILRAETAALAAAALVCARKCARTSAPNNCHE